MNILIRRIGVSCLLVSAGFLSGCLSAPQDVIRVGTYNIRQSDGDAAGTDRENGWDQRKGDLVDLVRKMDLDVFGLQEVTPQQMDYLQFRLPVFVFVGDYRNEDRISGEASPVCYRKSRFEELKKGTFWLSETPDVPGSKGWGAACPRVCSYVVLRERTCGKTFCFANTHADHVSALAREKGLLLVLGRLHDLGVDAPVVFTGDLNCRENERPAVIVSSVLKNALYATETPPVGGWRTWNDWRWRAAEVPATEALRYSLAARNEGVAPSDGGARDRAAPQDGSFYELCGGPRIDYVYVSPGVRVLDYATVNDARPGKDLYPSDHFPVTATVVLP